MDRVARRRRINRRNQRGARRSLPRLVLDGQGALDFGHRNAHHVDVEADAGAGDRGEKIVVRQHAHVVANGEVRSRGDHVVGRHEED